MCCVREGYHPKGYEGCDCVCGRQAKPVGPSAHLRLLRGPQPTLMFRSLHPALSGAHWHLMHNLVRPSPTHGVWVLRHHHQLFDRLGSHIAVPEQPFAPTSLRSHRAKGVEEVARAVDRALHRPLQPFHQRKTMQHRMVGCKRDPTIILSASHNTPSAPCWGPDRVARKEGFDRKGMGSS